MAITDIGARLRSDPLADARGSVLGCLDARVAPPPSHRTARVSKRIRNRGSALLAVLWLSAALAAIGFSLSTTVRGEIERTSTEGDSLRSYYLATGAIDRASVELLWSVTTTPDKRKIPKASTGVTYTFASGDARVEFIPEAAKLDVNQVPVDEIYRVIAALGVDPDRAREIAMGIGEWRKPGAANLSVTPSFQPAHASFQEIEELLAVRGVTPDIFYGSYVPSEGGSGPHLIARPGLIDCLSVFGSKDRVDANAAQPAVLIAVGLSPDAAHAIAERRRTQPFTGDEQLAGFVQSVGGSMTRLRVEGNSIVTMRATAQLRLPNGQMSDLKRTVAAMVKYMPDGYDSKIHILRWYDTAWSN